MGVLIGYFLSRLRHQGTIQELTVRVSHKDDVIKLKDDAIASASAPRAAAPMVEIFQNAREAELPRAERRNSQADARFIEINAKIISDLEEKIRNAVLNTRYTLVFNPISGRSKPLTFNANGEIAQGKNNNEHRWRISGGRLEILDNGGNVYSRFFLLPDGKSLHHTNDPDTISIKGQYLKPVG